MRFNSNLQTYVASRVIVCSVINVEVILTVYSKQLITQPLLSGETLAQECCLDPCSCYRKAG